MSSIDWNLIIGYTLEDAQEYLDAEEQHYHIQFTRPPRTESKSLDDEEDVRVVGIRKDSDCLILICAVPDWSVC